MTAAVDAEAVRDFYEERAAILEFDGGLARNAAVQQALAETARAFGISIDAAARCAFLNAAALAAIERAAS
jgi:hypothetical protein